MTLKLEQISQMVGGQMNLYPLNLTLVPNAVTVLLGATQAGKTSLMRLMAGLDTPTEGRVWVDGKDVTGMGVRERNVAMVYQQFINYPSMNVYDNIASPLRLRGDKDTDAQVRALAARLRIDPFLDRLPAALSGGQQQRVALARALAKQAPLMFLDEPLVNLDYKLREELREDLTQLFEAGSGTVVYATTEPTEALLLGGHTAVMKEGRVLQYGPTLEVFRQPQSLDVARAFSDPPINVLQARAMAGGGWQLDDHSALALTQIASGAGHVQIGLRATALRTDQRTGDVALQAMVQLAEISGTDTFVHLSCGSLELVMQKTGVHFFDIGAALQVYWNERDAYVFNDRGELMRSPLATQEAS
ncbi:MAG: ABC transporter ATP-binding protein [Burkholderiales bacterium]|jgi:glycerol transport system ATP-binding protein